MCSLGSVTISLCSQQISQSYGSSLVPPPAYGIYGMCVYLYGNVTIGSLESLLGPLAYFSSLSDHINPQRNQFKIKLAPPSRCKETRSFCSQPDKEQDTL